MDSTILLFVTYWKLWCVKGILRAHNHDLTWQRPRPERGHLFIGITFYFTLEIYLYRCVYLFGVVIKKWFKTPEQPPLPIKMNYKEIYAGPPVYAICNSNWVNPIGVDLWSFRNSSMYAEEERKRSKIHLNATTDWTCIYCPINWWSLLSTSRGFYRTHRTARTQQLNSRID